MIRRFFAATLLAVGVLVLTATPAFAHAILVASSPGDGAHLDTSPTIVSLTYSEHVSAPLGAVRVFDQEGKRVDNGNVVARDATVTVGLDRTLDDGCYVVSWRVISADSHAVRGAFNFSVGNATSTCTSFVDDSSDRRWEIAGAVARGFAYAGTLLAAGGALFLAVVPHLGDRRARLAKVVRGSAVVGGAGVLAVLPIQAALATGLGITSITKPGVLSDITTDGVGLSAVLAVVGLAVLAVGLHRRVFAFVGGATAAVSFAAAGHTTTTDPRWLSISADVVHAVAAAAWFGGLVLLVVFLRGRDREQTDAITTGKIVARFMTIATFAVVAVIVTGVALGWTEVRALRALTSTTYGKLLIAKATLAAIVATIGAYNHVRLVPALQRASERRRDAWAHLMRTVRIEVVGMIAVLAITAVLVNVTPARTAAGIGTIYSKTEPLGQNSVNLVVDPNRAGRNSIHLYLLDNTGRPASLAEAVTLELSLPSNQLGPIKREPFVAGPGHYQLDSSDLSISGEWAIVVRAEVSKFEEQVATFDVTVNP